VIEDIKKETDKRMAKSVVALGQTFKKMRTGRAHTGLLEHISVSYYGADTPLKLDRGPNALWTEGGLIYAPPLR